MQLVVVPRAYTTIAERVNKGATPCLHHHPTPKIQTPNPKTSLLLMKIRDKVIEYVRNKFTSSPSQPISM